MSSTTKIINLAELRDADRIPAYAVIHAQAGADPNLLSPGVMQWSDCVFISRLADCHSFWLAQKKKLRISFAELFEPLLQHHCGSNYVAVFGNHPWQCLLYLDYQLRHDGSGLFMLPSRLDRNIYKSISWDGWFGIQHQLVEHLSRIRPRGFREEGLAARQAQLRRFIERMGLDTPWQMREARANSMTRRFGSWLGRIWQWTYTDDNDLHGFPWIAFHRASLPLVKRELDYPVNDWANIEVLLREDLARLCAQSVSQNDVHINRMSWRIKLFNYRQICVELSFRHPYSLSRDQPRYETALYQARYLYDDLMRQLVTRETDLDLPEHMPFIAWQLEINEHISLTPALWDLFAGDCEAFDYERILALQNKLPLGFESYQAAASFVPERSFAAAAIGANSAEMAEYFPWCSGANNKPLFYYPQILPIDPSQAVRKVFLERNSREWWLGEDALQTIRDYYMLQDSRGRRSWAYRDADGCWFKQGEFV